MIGPLKSHCQFANQVERKLKRTSGNPLSPLTQNKDMGAASQTLLNGVRSDDVYDACTATQASLDTIPPQSFP